MFVNINGNDLNVEVLGPDDAPVLIAHHGGGGIGSLAEPKATFGPLADIMRVVVFDARGCGLSEGKPPFSHAQWAADVDGLRQWLGVDEIAVAGGSYGGFIAMEYVAGRALDALIHRQGMRPAEVLRIGVQIADALARRLAICLIAVEVLSAA